MCPACGSARAAASMSRAARPKLKGIPPRRLRCRPDRESIDVYRLRRVQSSLAMQLAHPQSRAAQAKSAQQMIPQDILDSSSHLSSIHKSIRCAGRAGSASATGSFRVYSLYKPKVTRWSPRHQLSVTRDQVSRLNRCEKVLMRSAGDGGSGN